MPLQRPNLSTTYIYRPLLAVSLGAILPCELASCTNRTVIGLWVSWRRMTRALCGTMWERLPTCGVPTNHLLMIYGPLIAQSLGAVLPCEFATCAKRTGIFFSGSNFNDRTTQTALDPLAGSRFVPGKVLGYGGTPWTGPRPADRSEFRFRACSGHVNA